MAIDEPDGSVIEWLLDGDPAIRWQVMRDLLDVPPEMWEAERQRTLETGWVSDLLGCQVGRIRLQQRQKMPAQPVARLTFIEAIVHDGADDVEIVLAPGKEPRRLGQRFIPPIIRPVNRPVVAGADRKLLPERRL